MRSMVFPACVVAVGLSIAFAAMAADPAPPAGEAKAENVPAGNAPITFEQYRAWRLAAMERRLSEIDMQLGAPDLSPARKARIDERREKPFRALPVPMLSVSPWGKIQL